MEADPGPFNPALFIAEEIKAVREDTLVCFTHPALENAESVAGVAQHVVSSGRAWISVAVIPEGTVLRACITHDDSSAADIDVLCEELDGALANYRSLAR